MSPRYLAVLLALVLLAAPVALAAEDGGATWRDHPGAAVAAAAGVFVLAVLAVAGLGCAVAVTAAALPSLAASMDRRARGGGTRAFVSGSLVLVGVLLACAAAARAGPAGHAVVLLVGGTAAVLTLAGMLGTVPLVGERILSPRGAEASPLRRSVTGALALGLALAAGLALKAVPVAVVVALVVAGWPLGVAVSVLLPRRAAAPPPAAGPAGPTA